jgi:5-methylcytosine-specific restriction endonuclease McrA
VNGYVKSIVAKVEPEILSSLEELRKACPSADEVCRRGYTHQIKLTSLDEIEQINYLYRQRDQLNKSGELYEVDHKIPLFKGGLHTLENLQLLSCKEHRLKSKQDLKRYNLKESTRQTTAHCN